ncbi:hypothetical protein GQ42DRAFT_154403 [Ramicandelaber brevisporus]|nr:hypothetical protein GQ42DRAFT_154403 [Ramicandelaber brevisporus]
MLFKWLKSRGRRGQSSSNNDHRYLAESGRSAVVNRLFVLPYDLLEEIATAYFSRHEAAALRTVNSQFHAAFSRTFWHTLVANSSWMQSLPDTIWRKYGHLVRCARMEVNQLNGQWCKKLPGLIQVTLDISRLDFEMDGGIELLNLRRIRVVAREGSWAASAAIKCMDLAQQLEQRNKYLLVDWDFNLMEDEHIAVLDTIVKRIDDTARHSLSITYNASRPLILSQFAKLAQVLVKLDISGRFGDFRDFFLYCNGNRNTKYTFPRLTTLIVRAHYNATEDELLRSTITPVYFPSLANIAYKSVYASYHMPGLSVDISYDWSSIREWKLQSSTESNVVSQALRQIPNLERLIFEWCILRLNMTSLAKYLPRLSYFEFGSKVRLVGDPRRISRVDGKVHTPMARLKEIVFTFEEYGRYYDYATSRELFLKFIFRGGAPSLRLLEFRGSGTVDWNKYTLERGPQVNAAVRTLVLHGEHKDFSVSSLPKLRAAFPGLKFLTLRECTAATHKKLAKRYPYLIVTVEPL